MFTSEGKKLKKNRFLVPMLFGLLFLSGCAGGTAAAPSATSAVLTPTVVIAATPTVTPDVDVDVQKLKGMQVTLIHPWSGELAKLMDSLVAEFNQTNTWGIQITVEAPGSAGSLQNSLTEDLQTSLSPEIIVAPIDELLALNQKKQTVADLSPYVTSKKWGMDETTIQNYLPVFWDQDVVNGYRYGIPAERSAKVMLYNKTWATELGYTNAPVTPEEFQSQVCAAHASLKLDSDKTNDSLGGWVIDTDTLTMTSWATAFGTPLETDGKLKFATPELDKTFTYLRTLLDMGCAWNGKETSFYNYFAKRQTLIYSADLQELTNQQMAQTVAGSTDEWVVIPYPTTGKTFILTQGPSYAMLTASPEKQLAAWLFIRWMGSPDHYGAVVKASNTLPLGENLINYSIELEDTLPQWKEAVNLLQDSQTIPADANWGNAKMIWEDAAWQLFKTDVKTAQIPALTTQMDVTLKELEGASQ
jgi:multiple sugar transport system substrate-binding protein/sn-glycerol 3-phosphate transport system substrate-binding protein